MALKPGNLIKQLRKKPLAAPGYLFLGAEPFYRSRCYQAVLTAALGAKPDLTARVVIDLKDQPLSDLVDEARALALFGSDRLVVGLNAEKAVPATAGRAARAATRMLAQYFKDPSPGTTVLLEAVQYDGRDRADKQKLQRLAKFFSAVPVQVDLEPLTVTDARFVGKVLARRLGLRIGSAAVAQLVEMLGADAYRLENELEKLALYVAKGEEVTPEVLEKLVPEARQSGVFEFSEALVKGDRARALRLLDTMAKGGVYWPMQLNLIASVLRQALAAKELGVRTAQQINAKLRSIGLRTWFARAQQIEGLVARFSRRDLSEALIAVFEADRSLRSSRPDDRLIVELLVMKLTR